MAAVNRDASTQSSALGFLHVVVYKSGERTIETHDGRSVAADVAPEVAQQFAASGDLLAELEKAHEIIVVMLNLMSTEAKFEAAKVLEERGISPDGMTRRHERESVITRAKS